MADALGTTVRFLHVFFGVAWVGGAIFAMHVMLTGFRKLPPATGGPAIATMQRKALTFFGLAGALTVLFGLWNQWLIAGELDFRSSTWNVLLGASLVIALVVIGISLGNNLPAFRRLDAMPPQERGSPAGLALQKRLRLGAMSMTALLVVALFLMVRLTALRAGP